MLINLSFLVVFFILLWLKDLLLISFALILILAIAHKDLFRLSKKVFKSIILFNLGVSAGYLVMALLKDISPWYYILYINLKVFTMTFFVFWFFSQVSIIEFFSFSKELSYLLSITISQIYSYQKTFEDFRLAYRARFVKNYRQRKNDFIRVVFSFFLKKSISDSQQRVLAMRARGFFD